MTEVTNPELFRLVVLRGALYIETATLLKRRGPPASVAVRQLLGVKTKDKKKLLAQYEQWLKDAYGLPKRYSK